MQAELNGCTCNDETTRACPIHSPLKPKCPRCSGGTSYDPCTCTPEELLATIFEEDPQNKIERVPTHRLNDFKPHEFHLRLKELRQFVADHPEMPDDTPILIERIEDEYFDRHGWKTFDIQFSDMVGPQRFSQAWCITHFDNMVLIHAHY